MNPVYLTHYQRTAFSRAHPKKRVLMHWQTGPQIA